MRLNDWPRMPFLNDEVKEWIGLELRQMGVEDLAVYALEAGAEGDERRIIVATEVGLLDHRYAPFGSSARYRLAMLLYPWQVMRGVELRADTFRLWAMEHRTRWSFRLHYPHFEAATESPDLGQALCDLARVCAVMAEPFGVPAGRGGGNGTPAARADDAAAISVGERGRPHPDQAPTIMTATPTPISSDGNEPEPAAEDEAAPSEQVAGVTDGGSENGSPADADAEASADAGAEADAGEAGLTTEASNGGEPAAEEEVVLEELTALREDEGEDRP